jgi:hypothetical protein
MPKNKSQGSLPKHVVVALFLYVMVIPVVFADICIEVYHRICFPLCGMPYVVRSHYIRILDRGKLPYLTWIEKIGCAYCGYVNGWFHYASVIAGKTESYWCAVAHLEVRGYVPSQHEMSFVKYGDEAAFRRRYALHDEKYGKNESGE